MLKIEGTIVRVLQDSRRFFKNTRIVHAVLAVLLTADGILAAILSSGSDGTAQVPYFFSSFIAAAWHLIFIVNCQICMYYLVENCNREQDAPTWVRVYSVSSSVFVLFNVMGVVFAVVNGMCIDNQMCYYDRHEIANRMLAIMLILLHCVSIVFSVFLAKRSHLIDSELNADIGIKLNQVITFLRMRRQRSVASIQEVTGDRESSSPSQSSSNQTEIGLSEVQNKHGHVLTTIEISAMAHRKTHRRSKSQPNMVKQLGLLHQENNTGNVFSIYSDTEAGPADKADEKVKKERKYSKRLKTSALSDRKRSKSENHVDDLPSDSESFASSEKPILPTSSRKSITASITSYQGSVISSVSKSGGQVEQENIVIVRAVGMDEANYRQEQLLRKQEKLQKQQERLLEEQSKLFLAQKQGNSMQDDPPPYHDMGSSKTEQYEGKDVPL